MAHHSGFVVLSAAALSGLGGYVGRFLRWNSWDALLRPQSLAVELLQLLGDPSAYPRLVGVSGLIACMMLLGYGTLLSAQGTRKASGLMQSPQANADRADRTD